MKWLAGLVAGAVGAIIASLVSLPLDSPDDVVFNTFTVTVGALAVGLAGGLVWALLPEGGAKLRLFAAACVVGFAAAAIVGFLFEGALDGSGMFVLPLAAIVFGCILVIAPALSAIEWSRLAMYGGAAILAGAVALGLGLMGQGDEESGKLTLPEVKETPVADGAEGDETAETAVITLDDVAGAAFTVVTEESEATYTVREKLANLPSESDAVGRTKSLSGTVRLDGVSTVTVDLSTLTSDQERRDNFIRNNIFQTDPIAEFTVEQLPGLPSEYQEGETVTSTVTGRMKIRGVERDLTFEVEARLRGGTLEILGKTDFTWADFEIDPPNTPLVTVQDNVHLEVLIIARRDTGA